MCTFGCQVVMCPTQNSIRHPCRSTGTALFLDETDKPAVIARALWSVLGRLPIGARRRGCGSARSSAPSLCRACPAAFLPEIAGYATTGLPFAPNLVHEARVGPRCTILRGASCPAALAFQNFAQRNHQSVFKPVFRQRRFCVPVH